MTLQYLLRGCPNCLYSDIQVYVGNNPVYDYKEGDQSIYLLSHPLEITEELEPITLQELIDYSEELEYPEDNIIFLCEYELQELTSSSWLGTKLILHF